MMQQELFPLLERVVGPLSKELELLSSMLALVPLERLIATLGAATGRPAKDRAALATAFMAKTILNLPTTRSLLSRLKADEALRQFCGWASFEAVPHESKFSRAFAQFAAMELPQQLHKAVVLDTQKGRLIGHIARDSTAIPARERFAVTAEHKKQRQEKKRAKQKHRELKQKALRNKTIEDSYSRYRLQTRH
jgi:hypothetical protein